MNTVAEEVKFIPNRTMEIANLYHKQSLALINLALTQNKLAIEASHQRASELLQIKEPKDVHQLVSTQILLFALTKWDLTHMHRWWVFSKTRLKTTEI